MASPVMDAHFERERIAALRQMGVSTEAIEEQVAASAAATDADVAARRESQAAAIRAGSPA